MTVQVSVTVQVVVVGLNCVTVHVVVVGLYWVTVQVEVVGLYSVTVQVEVKPFPGTVTVQVEV